MTLTYDILNGAGSPDEEFVMEECSGYEDEHSDIARDALEDHDCQSGNWVTVADGEVIEDSEFHPFRIHWESDDNIDSPLGDIDSGDIEDYASLD